MAIVNENCIWAVGEIYVADTSANGYTMYNAVHWDGNEWNLKRITVNFRGFLITPVLEGIFAFSSTQIWLAGGLTIFGDGTNWTPYDIRLITGIDGLSASKIWGSSPDNMYFVGRNGNIAHYNGSQWRKIESGTTAEVKDIWGSVDPVTGEKFLLCAVSNQFEPGDRKILRINSQGIVDSLHWLTDRRVASIWFSNQRKLFVCGGGVFIRNLDGKWVEQTTVPLYYTYRIRGIANNDLFVAGGFGLIAHYNGVQWRVWENLGSLIWYSAAYSGGIFVAVGQTSNQAIVLAGRR